MELLETWIFLLYRIFLIISYFSYRILATEISAFRRHITSSGCRMRLDSHRLKPIWIGEKAGVSAKQLKSPGPQRRIPVAN